MASPRPAGDERATSGGFQVKRFKGNPLKRKQTPLSKNKIPFKKKKPEVVKVLDEGAEGVAVRCNQHL